MPHDQAESADHTASQAPPAGAPGPSFVPLAEAVPTPAEAPGELTPEPEGPPGGLPERWPWPGPPPGPWPWPGGHLHPCLIALRPGCYRISFNPQSLVYYAGTMRVDTAGGSTTISGDLYRFFRLLPPRPEIEAERTGLAGSATLFPRPYGIPIYARNRYHSYLKVT